jgi:hypothetical protein
MFFFKLDLMTQHSKIYLFGFYHYWVKHTIRPLYKSFFLSNITRNPTKYYPVMKEQYNLQHQQEIIINPFKRSSSVIYFKNHQSY